MHACMFDACFGAFLETPNLQISMSPDADTTSDLMQIPHLEFGVLELRRLQTFQISRSRLHEDQKQMQ